MPKFKTNEEFVSNLMRYSPVGGLVQAFIIQAILNYSKAVAAEKPEDLDTGLVSGHAWHRCAVDIQQRMKEQGYD